MKRAIIGIFIFVLWTANLAGEYYSQGRVVNLSVLQGTALDSVNFEILNATETKVLDTTITPLAGTSSKVVRLWWTLPSGLVDGLHTCFQKIYFEDGRVYYDEVPFLVYNDFQDIADLTTTTLLTESLLGMGTVGEALQNYNRAYLRMRTHYSTAAVTAQGIPGGGYQQWSCIEIDSLRTWASPQIKYYYLYHWTYDGFRGEYISDYTKADADSVW